MNLDCIYMNFEQKVRAFPLIRTCWPDQSIHKENYPIIQSGPNKSVLP